MPKTIPWPKDKPRFQAEWIHSQIADEDGEWVSDCDEHRVSYHLTKELAEQSALASSKAAPAHFEWIRVAETRWENGEWVTYRAWTGDWDGLQKEPCHELVGAD